jgi:purine-binding chemotaxis protein CheW
MSTTTSQVLEFALGDEEYCVSIDHVTEIVDVGDVTTIPNAPPYVEGVMDLRGRTTAIVDPKSIFDIEERVDPKRIVVFDPQVVADGTAAGWLVDEVDQVSSVEDGSVDRSPAGGDDGVKGIVRREEDFVIWIDPAAVHA